MFVNHSPVGLMCSLTSMACVYSFYSIVSQDGLCVYTIVGLAHLMCNHYSPVSVMWSEANTARVMLIMPVVSLVWKLSRVGSQCSFSAVFGSKGEPQSSVLLDIMS